MLTSSIHNFLRSLMLPLREINEAIPKSGAIIDLGCGEGVIAKYLAKNKGRNVIGIDLNEKRLEKSNQKNLKFRIADIRSYGVRKADGIIISDVLHHLNFQDQQRVLDNIVKGVKNGGILIIKEIDTDEFIRSKLSRFWDFVSYPKDKIYFSNASDLKNKLENFGFRVKILRPCRFFPGSTTLFICTK